MAFCTNCGAQLQDGAQFCTSCGAPAAPDAQQQPQPQPQYPPQHPYMMNGSSVDPEREMEFDPLDVQKNKVNAVLAYLGILVLVPVFSAKDSKFARFHANQGLVLLIAEVAYGTIYRILNGILQMISSNLRIVSVPLSLVYLVFLIFSILGIVYAAKGQAKKLPVVGDFKILK